MGMICGGENCGEGKNGVNFPQRGSFFYRWVKVEIYMNGGGRKCYTLPETNMTTPLKNGGKTPGSSEIPSLETILFRGKLLLVSGRASQFLKTYTSKVWVFEIYGSESGCINLQPVSATKTKKSPRLAAICFPPKKGGRVC